MKQRGATPDEDRANGWVEEGPITACTETETTWEICVNGWTSLLLKTRTTAVPKIGDTFTTFGQIGYQFHGQALNGETLWYHTVEQEQADNDRHAVEADERRASLYVADKPRLDAEYAALPDTFKERIDKFRNTNPYFRQDFEAYEMLCCTDAVKVARYCSITNLTPGTGIEPTAADNLEVFSKLPYAEQKKAGISNGHSGNSFDMVLQLAYHYVTDPGLVIQEHGALTLLVGCVVYGCPHD